MSKQQPNQNKTQQDNKSTNRRTFLKASSAVVAGGAMALNSAKPATAKGFHSGVSEAVKVGLIGCGGRGTGAAVNAMKASKDNQLVALCDIFPDRVDHCKQLLERQLGNQCAVADDHCFSDFSGYQRLLETDVDVVLLATTPYFRPQQLAACIDAGKHVFCEKPVAVDAPGVRSVYETCEKAEEKGLAVVSGLCWRYDLGVKATMDKIKSGAIGDIRAIQENYLTGTLWHRGRKDDWSEMEYQIRNWLYFTWLAGDHIVEQHIHSLDKALWLNDDEPPVAAHGIGGRQVRTEDQWGNIYDHFAVCYEWKSGVKTFAYTRQMQGCFNQVEDFVLGTKGDAKVLANEVNGEGGEWKYDGPKPSMYDLEHVALFDSIREGKPINNGKYMCYSTLMAILGREVCYTGEQITWDDMWNSNTVLGPKSNMLDWGDVEVPGVRQPNETEFERA